MVRQLCRAQLLHVGSPRFRVRAPSRPVRLRAVGCPEHSAASFRSHSGGHEYAAFVSVERSRRPTSSLHGQVACSPSSIRAAAHQHQPRYQVWDERQQWYDATCQEIKAGQSWLELQAIHRQHGRLLDRIQLVALLSGLAKTTPATAAPADEVHQFHALVGNVLAAVATHHAARLRPREIATALWAGAKAGMPPSTWSTWLPPLLRAAAQQLPHGNFNPQDLSMLLWALATLEEGSERKQSGGSGAAAYSFKAGQGEQRATAGGSSSGGWQGSGEGHTSSFRQRASRSLRLPPGLLDAALGSAGSQMPGFGAQALSNTLWALAKLGTRPSDAWLEAALERMEVIMPSCTPQALCNVSWALITLDYSPSAAWRQGFLYHSGLALEFGIPKVLAQLIWSAARLQLAPDQCWLETCLHRASCFQWQPPASPELGASENPGRAGTQQRWEAQHLLASPQDLANILWALAVQPRFRPSPEHMQRLVTGSLQCVSRFDPNELCCVVWALAKLGYMPPPQAMQQLLTAVARAAPKCTPQGLCNVVWAVATLHITPEQHWMQDVLSNLIPKLEDCGPQELANLWWALGSQRWRLGPALRQELAAELRVNVLEFNAGETAIVLWALARLGLQPQPEVLQRQLELLSAARVQNPPGHSSGNDSRSSASGMASTSSISVSGTGGDGFVPLATDGDGEWFKEWAVDSSSIDSLQPRTVSAVLWALAEMDKAVKLEGLAEGILYPSHRRALHRLLLACVRQPQGQGEPLALCGALDLHASARHGHVRAGQHATASSMPGAAVQVRKAAARSSAGLVHPEAASGAAVGDLAGKPAPVLPGWGYQELAISLFSLGKLSVMPPQPWLQAAIQALQQLHLMALVTQQLQAAQAAPQAGPLPAGRSDAGQGQQGAATAVTAGMGAVDAGQAPVQGPAAAGGMLQMQGTPRRYMRAMTLSMRDAAMVAHGLAMVQRRGLLPAPAQPRPDLAHAAASQAALARSLFQPAGHTRAVVLQPGAQRKAASFKVPQRVLRLLIARGVQGADVASDRELVMLLSAVPVLARCGQWRVHLRWQKLQRLGTASRMGAADRTHRLARAVQKNLKDISRLLSAAEQRMSAGQTSSRDAVAFACAAARMGIQVDAAFVQAVMEACAARSPLAAGARATDLRAQALAGPTCRDWVLCLWAVERLLPHRVLLRGSVSLAWVEQAASSVIQKLSRPGRPLTPLQAPVHATAGVQAGYPAALASGSALRAVLKPSDVPGVTGIPKWRLRQMLWRQHQQDVRRLRAEQPPTALVRLRQGQRWRHVARLGELQAAAAAAARLSRSALAQAGTRSPAGSEVKGSEERLRSGQGGAGSAGGEAAAAEAWGTGAGKEQQAVAGQGQQRQQQLAILAGKLRRASGLLKQVHARRLAIQRASKLAARLRQRQQQALRR